MPATLTSRRFTVDEYDRMIEVGILYEDERVELIEGEIIRMAPINSRHAGCVNGLNQLFVRAVGADGVVAVQNPVRLDDLSEPEPDIAVLRPRADNYVEAHPRPDDVLLLIEVADTTTGYDRERKAPLYAAAGIQEYWLVDLPGAEIEVHRDPGPGGYRDIRRTRRGEVLHPLSFPELGVEVGEILP